MNAESAPRDGDDRLVEALRRALAEADEVPTEVVAAARAAWTWRTIDAELAALVHDSTLDDQELAGVRGATVRAELHRRRALPRAGGGRGRRPPVDRRSGDAGPRARLILEGATAAAVDLAVDALGRFSATASLRPGAPAGGGRSLVTEWVAISGRRGGQ
jgi:hypothetical protein